MQKQVHEKGHHDSYADSGKDAGTYMGTVEFLIGPATARTAVEYAASSGQKIYSSQTEYLAGEAVSAYQK